MALSITSLRRWFAGGAILVVVIVAGVYFYARHRVQNALKQVPEKIGLEIKQSATGFSISKSEQGRTLFKIEASKAVQFKEGERAELHDVTITVYGRDSRRYDQIYGKDFEYDARSGNVTAKGEIEIDLEANPAGMLNPDQAAPKELKNPIHLKTSGLVFNQKTGDAYTNEEVEFRLPQASGSALGVSYAGHSNVLTLKSNLAIRAANGAEIKAASGSITRNPREVVLDHPRVRLPDRECESDRATLFLSSDNKLDRVLAAGNVKVASQEQPANVHSDQLEIIVAKEHDRLRTAVFSGNVVAGGSDGQAEMNAGRLTLDFSGKNVLKAARAEENVTLRQQPAAGAKAGQEMELMAQAVDLIPSAAKHLERAETSGTAQITIRSDGAGQASRTVVTAGKFVAHFDDSGRLSTMDGSPNAEIRSQNSGQQDRISVSQNVHAIFRPGGGIESIEQQGNVSYTDGERKAWGDRALYTPADQMLVVSGSPRVAEGGMSTTARTMRLNRATGEALADGDVKSTYSDLKAQPDGALLASSSPIHVTAKSMTVHGTAAIALYTGGARLWQDANVVEASSIEFDRDRRSVSAHGAGAHSVSTVLIQNDQSGNPVAVAIRSSGLTYTDNQRQAHFDGEVVVTSADATITAKQADAFLEARGKTQQLKSSTPAGKLDKIVAQGNVVITQPSRRATGEKLVYDAPDDKFVLSGGPPSIFDAEHGKITGVSLTFYRHDDTVLVEGNTSSPAVTQTRVAR